MKKLVLLIFLIIISSGTVFGATQDIDFSFSIPPKASVVIPQYDIDFGNVDVQDESWSPIGDSNSFKVYVQNNYDNAWSFRVNLFDDLYRQEGVDDPAKDIMTADQIRWTIVYAQAGLSQVARDSSDESNIPGLQSGSMIDNSAAIKGTSFTTLSDLSAGLIYVNPGGTGQSYNHQFVFKFIAKPLASTTAGTYSGKIIFTMIMQ